ncbi:ATP-binding cassette domain-containing protein [Heyndrickxia sp. NPDC080065]|uniref:ATP-binding cassette domain-containing protein n=1 Tax=Heyndrickxia sp. NPDC080065 TaxID=3390568 RepID=UPI003D061CD7
MGVIELKNVYKDIGEFSLGPINVEIPYGSIVAIVGDNGAGKSTLIKTIQGLAKETSGEVFLFGERRKLDDESWRNRIAYQSQTLKGCDRFTGKDLHQLISHYSMTFNEEAFERYVKDLDIPLNKPFINLSEGVRKKLNLALTFAQNKELFIMDEPTAHLDMMAQRYVMDEIVRLMEADSERTILFASHQLDDIRKLADYILLIRKGNFLGMYEKDELTLMYRRYWLDTEVTSAFPGVVKISQQGREIISNNPQLTEQAFMQKGIHIIQKSNIDLDDILPWLLSGEIKLKDEKQLVNW